MYLKKKKSLPLVLDSDNGHTCDKTQKMLQDFSKLDMSIGFLRKINSKKLKETYISFGSKIHKRKIKLIDKVINSSSRIKQSPHAVAVTSSKFNPTDDKSKNLIDTTVYQESHYEA